MIPTPTQNQQSKALEKKQVKWWQNSQLLNKSCVKIWWETVGNFENILNKLKNKQARVLIGQTKDLNVIKLMLFYKKKYGKKIKKQYGKGKEETGIRL